MHISEPGCVIDRNQAMIDEFDKDSDGFINEEEFIDIMKQTTIY